MIDRYYDFIFNYLESTKFIDYYDDIIIFLNVNHTNIQYLLTNKKINYKNNKYYSTKNNKLLYEYINDTKFTDCLIAILNHIYNSDKEFEFTNTTLKILKDNFNNINEELKNNGCFVFKNILHRNKCKMILNKLNNKEFINRNTNEIKNIDLFKNNKNIWWLNNYIDLLNINVIQQIITSEYILKIAGDYLQCNPILHNILFWASYPGDKVNNVDTTQQFHQDFDDIKFLKIFFYLNDVDQNNGPHVYVKKSLNNMHLIQNNTNNDKLSQRYTDKIINNKFKNNIIHICGNTGSIIFEDTHGLHKGTNVIEGKRFVLQLIYGSSTFYHLKNSNYKKYECNTKIHNIIHKAFLKFPYSFMNFTFNE